MADTTTGNLEIETVVGSFCSLASGKLTLELDYNAPLTNQPLASPDVLTPECFGGASVVAVDFDNGQHRGNNGVGVPANGIRYMKRNGTDGASANHYLGYQLYGMANATWEGATAIAADTTLGTGATDNILELTSSLPFKLTAKIVEPSDRAFGNPTQLPATSNVPDGTYSDTVTMTLTYN
jgi:spore coat protein U-like protein